MENINIYYTFKGEKFLLVDEKTETTLETLEKIKKAVVEGNLVWFNEEVEHIYSGFNNKLSWLDRKFAYINDLLSSESLFNESYISKVDRIYQEIIGFSDRVNHDKPHQFLEELIYLKQELYRINNESNQQDRIKILLETMKVLEVPVTASIEFQSRIENFNNLKFDLKIKNAEEINELALLWHNNRPKYYPALPPFNINTTQDDTKKLQLLVQVLTDSRKMKDMADWTKAINIVDEKMRFKIALDAATIYPREFSDFIFTHFNITNEEHLLKLANCCITSPESRVDDLNHFFQFQIGYYGFQKEQVRFDLLMLGIEKCDTAGSRRLIEHASKSGLKEALSVQLLECAFKKNPKVAIDFLRFFSLTEKDKTTYFDRAVKECKFPNDSYINDFLDKIKKDSNWTSKNFKLIDLKYFFDTSFSNFHDEKDVKEWFWLFDAITKLQNNQMRKSLIYRLAHNKSKGLLGCQETKEKFISICGDTKKGKLAIPTLIIASWNYSKEELSKLSKFISLFKSSLLKDKNKLLLLSAALETLGSQLNLESKSAKNFDLRHLASIYPGPYKNQEITSKDFEAIIREISSLGELKSIQLQKEGEEKKDYYSSHFKEDFSNCLKMDQFNIETFEKTFGNRFGFDTIRNLFSFREKIQLSKNVNKKTLKLLDQLIKAYAEGNGDYRYQEESLGKHAKKVFSQREDLFNAWKKGACFEVEELLKNSNEKTKEKKIEIDDLKNVMEIIEKFPDDWHFLDEFFSDPNKSSEIRKKLGEKRQEKKEDQKIKDLLTVQDSLIRLLSDNNKLHKEEKNRLTKEAISKLETMKTSVVATELIAILNAIREPLKAKNASFEEYTVVDTDSPELLFHCGEHIQVSCLTFGDKTENTQILVGLMADPKIRMISVLDKSGKIVARAMLKILWDDENQRPVLLKEQTYNIPCRPELLDALEKAFIERARAMGLPYVRKFEVGDNPVDFDIHSLDGGLSPIEEISIIESKKSPLYTIPSYLLGMVYDPEEKL